ncbi:MAG TPA: hypothetical protein PLO14_03110 [Accumulibacter sp.]|uniref:hypothetical protein n=1 Tax=Accumulibacter sp. TaxID=2053492 RepID=UPI0025EC5708|nr:hypothetical protein [Accumulibacter sp.]MCM8599943.1 hypothetical protein [Accumulibacter sp.]MCM8664127.1 hypothetical protein [Accumulibacter sp.]HNC51217.1 hypothetical protein [Accumulibacter sp.]
MSLLVSMFVITTSMYCLFLLIREYNQLVFTRFRYRYFALRDELALLVMTGHIMESSWEYQHIVRTINFHISAVETMSITDVVSLLIRYHTSEDGKRKVRYLIRRVDDPAVVSILVRYMGVTQDLLRRNSRCQIVMIRAVKRLFGPDIRQGKHEFVQNPNEAINAIEQSKSDLLATVKNDSRYPMAVA